MRICLDWRKNRDAGERKFADIVAVPGNPLQDIRQTEHVFFVMKEGVVYKNESPCDPVTPLHDLLRR